jgi:hypothetical protein
MTHKEHYLLTEVATMLGVRGYQIAYLITNGKVPEPKLRIDNKRVFVAEDIAALRKVLAEKKAKKEARGK